MIDIVQPGKNVINEFPSNNSTRSFTVVRKSSYVNFNVRKDAISNVCRYLCMANLAVIHSAPCSSNSINGPITKSINGPITSETYDYVRQSFTFYSRFSIL